MTKGYPSVPDDRDLIKERLRLPRSGRSEPSKNVSFRVTSWLHRIGNSRSPDRSETVLSLYGKKVDEDPHAYLIFHATDSDAVPPPDYDGPNKRLFIHYTDQQLGSVYRILDMMDRVAIVIVYREYKTGHRWAELQHSPIS